ncbi:MAG TPA: hypothetical protein VHI13_21560 [Candidatus Kapabacteria bacterium]|nr:hypothetical protein [Candidatus Kapabacteria bacterium]
MTTAALSRPRLWKSTVAIAAGFFATAILSLGTDQILHLLNVYPPWDHPTLDPGLNLLALAYRIVYTVGGGYITARLAPRNALRHAVILGTIGLLPATAGAVVAIGSHLGPAWYPIALIATALPCTWLGGLLHGRRMNLRRTVVSE